MAEEKKKLERQVAIALGDRIALELCVVSLANSLPLQERKTFSSWLDTRISEAEGPNAPTYLSSYPDLKHAYVALFKRMRHGISLP
jgi:hypothetical protein